MFRIYYHLYLGSSWQDVWALHAPLLEEFAATGALNRLVVCVYGGRIADLGISSTALEVRHLSDTLHDVNEFNTLAEMQRDVADPALAFDYCVYLHSKGSSAPRMTPQAVEWSSFLARSLLRALPGFGRVVAMGFNTLGSNLAWGLFEDFGSPRLHYSGNFWCATRELVRTAPAIQLGGRYTAVRHNAEWWLGQGSAFTPFNVFSTGVDHYAAPAGAVDWDRLEARLMQFGSVPVSARHCMDCIGFLSASIQRLHGRASLRSALSRLLLRVLPHHRWRRLLNVHHVLMRCLGSRKSAYFFCPESA